MTYSNDTRNISMHETQQCLVVPIQEELSKETALQIQRSLLEQVHAKGVKGVVIDLSGVEIIDGALWEIFSKTVQMVNMLGASSVITGLSPGVVASLIDLDLDLDINNLTTARNLEDALETLTQKTAQDSEKINEVDEVENKNDFVVETDTDANYENTYSE